MKFLLLLALAALVFATEPAHEHIERPMKGDELCQFFREDSYCKVWQDPPVCQHLDIPCDGTPICPRYPWSDRRFDVLEGHGRWSGHKYVFGDKGHLVRKWPVSSHIYADGKGKLHGTMWAQGFWWTVTGTIDEHDKVELFLRRPSVWRHWKGVIRIDPKNTEYLEMHLELEGGKPAPIYKNQKMVIKLPDWCLKWLPKHFCPPCSYCKVWQDPMVCHRTDQPCFEKPKVPMSDAEL
ncbi:hypothetical protein P9112_013876 [Eukaryota sp. TZLM1-RC]